MYADLQKWELANDYYAVALRKLLEGNHVIRAKIYYDWADTFLGRNDWAGAENLYAHAIAEVGSTAANELALAEYFNGLSFVAEKRGDLASAEQYALRDLAIAERLVPNSLGIAYTLNNLGSIAWHRGNLARAEDYLHQSLMITEKSGEQSIDYAMSLNNFGSLIAERGDPSRAEQLFQAALKITQHVGNSDDGQSESHSVHRSAEAACLHNVGKMSMQLGEFAVAKEYFLKALTIRQELDPGGLSEASILYELGSLAVAIGDTGNANRSFNRALRIQSSLAPTSLSSAATANSLGALYLSQGELLKAETFLRSALTIREAVSPGSASHAETLVLLARLKRKGGHPQEAAKLYKEALKAIDSQAAHLGGSHENQTLFRARHAEYYEEYVDLLVSQNQYTSALELLERSRDRSLLEIVAAGRVDLHAGIDPNLVQRKRNIDAALFSKSLTRNRIANSRHSEDASRSINAEIAKLLEVREQVETTIRLHSPNYAALTQPKPLKLKEIQNELLNSDTILLEIMLRKEQSYLWLVSEHTISLHKVGERAKIEEYARQMHEAMQKSGSSNHNAGEEESRLLAKFRLQYSLSSDALSKILLEPISKQIKGKRICVVADGALQIIPFGALPVPPTTDALIRPLAADHEIVNLPSASVLAVLRNQTKSRTPPTRGIAILADPVFSSQDSRVKQPKQNKPHQLLALLITDHEKDAWKHRSTRTYEGPANLPRLPGTKVEAEKILAAVSSKDNYLALGFGASREAATSSELSNYRTIHFATHAVLDGVNPELSGLVLSLVNENGVAQNGFLGLEDIYNLKLSADLVVLSGCGTGLGREFRGEGLHGLTRGFMYAGVPRVVASLWEVDDIAMANFMALFYSAMEQYGIGPSAALQQAQLHFMKDERWNSPYYWAAFQLYGDWK